jgi:hypothetical protein
MKIRDADPGNALPGWWLGCAALACATCVLLFGLAIAQESVPLAFFSVLVLLLAATGLPWLLHRHQRREEAKRT